MSATSEGIRLNLGSGQNPIEGWVNVDKFGTPDVMWDLEMFPWPWPENSVSEVIMFHVLEHLGESPQVFLKIVQELYRICRDGATIHIAVPHPRHDDFLGDPTHVRPIMPDLWLLFSKRWNLFWKEKRASNSPLALYLDVDFEIVDQKYIPDARWLERVKNGEIQESQLGELNRQLNNVVKETRVELMVVKSPDTASRCTRFAPPTT
jgi:SAM-dependent methyltransferase